MDNNTPQKGTGFVNLSRYLGANQNNRLGNVVGQNLQNRAQGVRQDLSGLTNTFNQQRQANALDTGTNRDTRTRALENIMGGNTDISDATQRQFDAFRTGQYAGPMGLDTTKTNLVQNRANQLTDDIRGLNTVEGRGALLQQTVGNPQYTQGQKKLDTLLLGQQPQGFAQARQQAQGIGKSVEQQRAAAQQVGQTEAAKARQFGTDTQQQLQSNTGNIVSGLEQQAAAANTARPQVYQGLLDAIKAGDITPEQAQYLGLQEGVQTYGSNLNPFIKQSQIEANKSNIASEQDKAKLAALSKLSGTNGNISAIDASQVGGYKGPLDVNQQGIASDIAARKSAYEDLINRKVVGAYGNLGEFNTANMTPEQILDRAMINQSPITGRNAAERDAIVKQKQQYLNDINSNGEQYPGQKAELTRDIDFYSRLNNLINQSYQRTLT